MSLQSGAFRIVHAGHDVEAVHVAVGNTDDPPLICWTCHEEEHPQAAQRDKASSA